jgi:hypothetical protein
MTKMDSSRLEELLDWLADEVAARLRSGQALESGATAAPEPPSGAGSHSPDQEDATARPGTETPAAWPAPDSDEPSAEAAGNSGATVDEGLAPVTPAEEPLALQFPETAPAMDGLPSHAAQLLSRLVIGLLIAIVLINIPLGRHDLALARMMPSSATVVIRNGLLVKEADKLEVYVYQDGKFHWVTDTVVFERHGYQWKNVQDVTPGFLADYEIGRPLYLLAKCPDSPHIYRLENGAKHWIVDIPAFEAEGYQWSDVQVIDCNTLAAMPMGETIPPGRGPAPQP